MLDSIHGPSAKSSKTGRPGHRWLGKTFKTLKPPKATKFLLQPEGHRSSIEICLAVLIKEERFTQIVQLEIFHPDNYLKVRNCLEDIKVEHGLRKDVKASREIVLSRRNLKTKLLPMDSERDLKKAMTSYQKKEFTQFEVTERVEPGRVQLEPYRYSLRKRLVKQRISSAWKGKFIPSSYLKNWISSQELLELLRDEKQRVSSDMTNLTTLAKKILGGGLKLLATVILADVKPLWTILNEFAKNGMLDNKMPFDSDCPPKFCESIIADYENICRSQWQTMAVHLSQLRAEDPITFKDDYVLPFLQMETISSGGFGEIFEVEIHFAHQEVVNLSEPINQHPRFALKKFKRNADKNSLDFQRELRAMAHVSNKNNRHLMTLLTAFKHGSDFFLLLPLARSSLKDFLQCDNKAGNREYFDWCLHQVRGLIDGIHAIHGDHETGLLFTTEGNAPREIGYHHDLKPENILLVDKHMKVEPPMSDQEKDLGIWQISDFGLARFREVHSGSSSQNTKGTPVYAAPESTLEHVQTRAYDIWSFGCILVEVFIWLVEGPRGLERLKKERSIEVSCHISKAVHADCYWVNFPDGPHLKYAVSSAIQRVRAQQVFPELSGVINVIMDIASECLKTNRRERPKAKDLVNWISKIWDFESGKLLSTDQRSARELILRTSMLTQRSTIIHNQNYLDLRSAQSHPFTRESNGLFAVSDCIYYDTDSEYDTEECESLGDNSIASSSDSVAYWDEDQAATLSHQSVDRNSRFPNTFGEGGFGHDTPLARMVCTVVCRFLKASSQQYELIRARPANNSESSNARTSAGSSTPSTSSSPGQKRKSHRPRGPTSQRRESNDEDNEGDEGRSPKQRRGEPSSGPLVARLFACPYFKRNSAMHRRFRACVGPGFPTVSRLKEHLFRRHSLPLRCIICRTEFDSHADLDQHVYNRNCLPPTGNEPPIENDYVRGFNADQANALRRRRRQTPSLNEEERWKGIYRILFPDVNETEIPSPYNHEYPFQSPIDLNQAAVSPGSPVDGMTVLQSMSVQDRHTLEDIVRQVVREQFQGGSHGTVPLDLSHDGSLMQMPPTRFTGYQSNTPRLQTAQQFEMSQNMLSRLEMPMFSTNPFVLDMPPEISAISSMDINPSFSSSLVPIPNTVGMNHGLESSSGDSGYQSGPAISASPPDGIQPNSPSTDRIEEQRQNTNLMNMENIYSCLGQNWNGSNEPLDDIE